MEGLEELGVWGRGRGGGGREGGWGRGKGQRG